MSDAITRNYANNTIPTNDQLDPQHASANGQNRTGRGGNQARRNERGGVDKKLNDDARSSDARRTQGTQALRKMADPAAPRLDLSQVSVDEKRTVTLRIERPGRAPVNVKVSDRNITFTPETPLFAGSDSAPVAQSIDLAALEDMTEAQQDLMKDLQEALSGVDPEGSDAATHASVELAKGRLEAIADPTFWQDVNERVEKFNVQTLASGKEVSVQKELRLDIGPGPRIPLSNGRGSRPNPEATMTVVMGGEEKAARLADNGRQVSVGDKTYPIRFDEASGQWMVVTEHKNMTSAAARTTAVATEVNQRTVASVVNTLPPVRGDNGVELGGLKSAAGKPGSAEFTYERANGAIERVTVSNTGISFETYLPSDLPGVEDKDGFNRLKTGYAFRDINSWGGDGAEQVADFRAMLDDVDTSNLSDGQKALLEKTRTRMDVLQEPAFWQEVNADISNRLDAEIQGVGPVAVTDGSPVIIDRKLDSSGATTTKFFIEDKDGKRVEIEPRGDDKATLDGKDYDVATDLATGEFILVRAYRNADQVSNDEIAREMGKRLEAVAQSDVQPLQFDATNRPEPATVTMNDEIRLATADLFNDPDAFMPILNAVINEMHT